MEIDHEIFSMVSFPLPPDLRIRRAVDVNSYWQKYGHLVRINCLGGLIPPRNSVVRSADHPYTTTAVYRGWKATTHIIQTFGVISGM